MLTIQKAAVFDAAAVAALAQQLWPHHDTAALQAEFEPLLKDAVKKMVSLRGAWRKPAMRRGNLLLGSSILRNVD